jgi:hypothetical protein
MLRHKLSVVGVTSDGCTFQKKRLTWRDRESIQANYEEFKQIVLVPCISHRLQNGLKHLHRCNQHYQDSINEVPEMAVALRKPRSRAKLDTTCPAHCVTRWVYDFEIVRFVGEHLEQARQTFQDEEIPFSDGLLLLRPLLEKIAIQAKALQPDHSGIDIVYPAIRTLCHDVEQEARRLPSPKADAYRQFSLTMRRPCLDTTAGMLQLGFILTPSRRMKAR